MPKNLLLAFLPAFFGVESDISTTSPLSIPSTSSRGLKTPSSNFAFISITTYRTTGFKYLSLSQSHFHKLYIDTIKLKFSMNPIEDEFEKLRRFSVVNECPRCSKLSLVFKNN